MQPLNLSVLKRKYNDVPKFLLLAKFCTKINAEELWYHKFTETEFCVATLLCGYRKSLTALVFFR